MIEHLFDGLKKLLNSFFHLIIVLQPIFPFRVFVGIIVGMFACKTNNANNFLFMNFRKSYFLI